jgi:hypothetical protein
MLKLLPPMALALAPAVIGVVLPPAASAAARAFPIVLDLEAGAAWQALNDVQVPNDASGTRFAIDDITGAGPVPSARVQLAWPLGERHELRFLAAPLSLEETGQSDQPISFQGERFSPGAVTARYRFDSWRATWRYRWIERDGLSVKLGFTAKIRDASIQLTQGARSARKDNTGFVPLLHATVEKRLAPDWTLVADVDALAGGPGYAVDLGLRLSRDLGGGWSVSGGGRFLDGGADNDEVYAFARFSTLSIGISRRFD